MSVLFLEDAIWLHELNFSSVIYYLDLNLY